MKAIVTGANGFIGSYLCRYLVKNGYEVVAISKGFHPETQSLLKGIKQTSFNLLSPDEYSHLTEPADCIIHTATANDIISKDTAAGIELSAIGTKNILDFAVKNNIPKCIIFSTLQVYGTELTGQISEQSPLSFRNDYGLNHIYAELMGELYTRQNKVSCVAVRPSNVFGRIITPAFNRWNLVPGCFCKEALETGTITIRSSGKQVRNFVHLENICRGVDSILNHFPADFEVFNLASSLYLTMKEVAESVKKVFETEFQKPIEILIEGQDPVSTNFFNIDLSRLQSLGFTEDNRFTLETEIKEIINFLNKK